MSAEVWTAIFSGLTLVVFVVTAFAALVQLRHLRVNNSLSGLIMLLEDWQKPELQERMRHILLEFPARLKDEEFLTVLRGAERLARADHEWLQVCDFYEQLGSYVKYNMIEAAPLIDVSNNQIMSLWTSVEPAVAILRAKRGSDSIFENFEYLAVLSRKWNERHPNGAYPTNVPRWKQLLRR